MESATCTHISGLLHALVAMLPSQNPLPSCSGDSPLEEEALPITSFACAWKAPHKRKDNKAKISEISFDKHVYGRQTKHTYQSLVDYNPRPAELRGTAKDQLKVFLANVKGKGLGVSVLFDPDCRVWNSDSISQMTPLNKLCLPSEGDLTERVQAFKESLRLSPEKIRARERDTVNQSLSPQWYHARRYRLTASTLEGCFICCQPRHLILLYSKFYTHNNCLPGPLTGGEVVNLKLLRNTSSIKQMMAMWG